jgi:hypothetical protein
LQDKHVTDIYATREYFEYYNSLKPRDPRLPKPQYQPTIDLESFKVANKQGENAMPSQIEEFEKKMSGLNLQESLQQKGFD